MFSGADFKAQVAKTMQLFSAQEAPKDGKGNLVVDGAGKGEVYVEADESVVLLTGGGDFAELTGDFNQIDIQKGKEENKIVIKGDQNKLNADDSKNNIDVTGNKNNIDTNNGNNTINSTGNNNNIKTNNGNNTINSTGNSNNINTDNGNNTINSSGNNNNIKTDNGNNTIFSRGDNNNIATDHGDNDISSVGNYNKINTTNGDNVIVSKGDNNNITAVEGSNTVFSNGNTNTIVTGKGNDNIFSLGDHNKIDAGDGNNKIVFDGNDTEIKAGNGNNYISTLDFAIISETDDSVFTYSDFAERLLSRNFSDKSTQVDKSSVMDGILKELSPVDQELAKDIDFSQKAADGKPKYLIAKGKSDGLYHVYEYSSATTYKAVAGFTNGKRDYTKVTSGNGYLYLNNNTTTLGAAQQTTYMETTKTGIKGVNDVKITVGTGSNTMYLNVNQNLSIDGRSLQKGADGKYVNDNPNSFNNIFVTGEIVTDEIVRKWTENQNAEGAEQDGEKTTDPTLDIIVDKNYSTGSPLIVDFNKDGQVSAVAGKGVDVDNNGYADGAATGGDKMLAMSDMNGNGHIDGGEVFGDHTISPFTGEKLNAKNGFEALKMIAEQAQEHTGIACISNGEVNLAQLQTALKTVGINLGFISDGNITELEDLGHVAAINVEEYQEQDATGEVQHRQLGSYTDTEGQQYKTNDVWFKLFGK